MDVAGKIIIVTGGGAGIGAAMAKRFAAAGAAKIVVADLDGAAAKAVADSIGAEHAAIDVRDEAAIKALVAKVQGAHGPIDLFCSNAGVGGGDADRGNAASSPNADWTRAWEVNVMAHVYAARAVLPSMIERKSGYILNTVSAAGLLNQIGSAVYSTTKHAAVGFAESLAITHGDQGIKVSILCPQGVDTAMLRAGGSADQPQNLDGVLTPEAVADAVIEGLAAETFLILPHPKVTTYMQRKTGDYDRWLGGMRRLRAKTISG